MTSKIIASIDAAIASLDRAIEAHPTGADDDLPPSIPEMILTHHEIMAFEVYRFEQLRLIAQQMTALGLEGEDPENPRIRALLERGAEATETFPELVEWIAKHK